MNNVDYFHYEITKGLESLSHMHFDLRSVYQDVMVMILLTRACRMALTIAFMERV